MAAAGFGGGGAGGFGGPAAGELLHHSLATLQLAVLLH